MNATEFEGLPRGLSPGVRRLLWETVLELLVLPLHVVHWAWTARAQRRELTAWLQHPDKDHHAAPDANPPR